MYTFFLLFSPILVTQPGEATSSIPCPEFESTRQTKRERTSLRINQLLTTINHKNGKKDKQTKKPLKIQIRWQKKEDDGSTMFVKPCNGGGQRFATFQSDENPVFHDVIEKGKKYFFDGGSNFFGEKLDDVLCKILDSSGNKVNSMDDVRTYLQENGLFPSKTFFIFQTVRLDISDSDSDSEFMPSVFTSSTASTSNGQRKICKDCGGTVLLYCLKCKQNKEYEEALVLDQNSNHQHQDDTSNDNSLHQNPGNITELRQRRLDFLDVKKGLFEEINDCQQLFQSTDYQTFMIRRRHLVTDVLKKMKLFFSDKPLTPIKVEFESANCSRSSH